ncbi:DHA2 family efflux MFS transporter permease subunit [Candidatus Solirubrobacter pratensis]|uniref:DHA2 family efflux MFS transporter permease subunit n=1 Tax=Candidatus Solirubrobacter pratensis TaxID=1298857 RepID=UPI00040D3A64|nr:DHA2 family efflux MFS transporter permease subunit [Candidatus Solirubrobacter pratensis]
MIEYCAETDGMREQDATCHHLEVPSPGLDRALLRLAAVVVLGTIMSILDTTIVNVAIETLGRELDAPLSSIQWVATGYLLALATVIPLTGWAMERFGGKRAWMTSVALFLLGSTLCGLAWSTTSLIAFRVLQGFGGGMIMPIGQAILAQAAGPERMGRVMSVIGVPTLLGPILGPVIGGLIIDNASWRWIFFVNVPVGAVALVLAARVLPGVEAASARARLDVRGLLMLSPGLAALVYALSEVGIQGGLGETRVLVALVAGVVLLGLVARHGLRGNGTLIDLGLFRDRAFAAASGTVFIFGVSLFGAMLILPLYYQVVRGQSALEAGLLLAPQGLGAAIAMPIAGRLTDKLGAGRIVPFGVIVALVGTGAYTQLAADTPFGLLAFALWVRGVGLGVTMMPSMAAAYQTLSRAAVPRATTAINIIRTIGGSFGTAVLSVVLERRIAANLPGVGGSLASVRGSAEGAAPPPRVADALAHAFGQTFWWAVGLTALALIPAYFLPRRPPEAAPAGAAEAAAAEA